MVLPQPGCIKLESSLNSTGCGNTRPLAATNGNNLHFEERNIQILALQSSEVERLFLNKFIFKDKQERYLKFLSNSKTRNKFIDKLYHFEDLNWKLFREIPGSENEQETISLKVSSRKNISKCYVISSDSQFDGRIMSVEEAIKDVVGIEGSILIFGEAEIVYYEGEAPSRRYISL